MIAIINGDVSNRASNTLSETDRPKWKYRKKNSIKFILIPFNTPQNR